MELNQRTAGSNGRLWGLHARDWSEIQEGLVRPAYEAVFARVGLTTGNVASRYGPRGGHGIADVGSSRRDGFGHRSVGRSTGHRAPALNASGAAARAIEHSGVAAVTEAQLKAITPFERPDGSILIRASFRCLLADR
jgi:hypothetical protein